MSRGIQIAEDSYWSAATWATDHVLRVTHRFLPETTHASVLRELNPDESWRDADLTELSAPEFHQLFEAAEQALETVERAGPNSEWFNNPTFFPGFLERFRELLALLRQDPRLQAAPPKEP